MKVFGKVDSFVQSFAKILLFFGVIFLVLSFGINVLKNDKKEIVNTKTTIDSHQRNKMYSILAKGESSDDKTTKFFGRASRLAYCSLIGEACTNNPEDAQTDFKSSWVGIISGIIIIPYQNPPASGIYALRDSFENAGFIPQTYAAQGVGFASLKPIAKLWKLFRDFSYIFLVLILIIMGFMIMFRMKINPQTVVGLEQAIPSIILSLILITFSFAIAGFLIDLMYVLIAVGISLLSGANVGELVQSNTQHLQNKYIGGGFWTIWPYHGTMGALDTGHALYSIFPNFIKAVMGGFLNLFLIQILSFGKLNVVKYFIHSFRDIGAGTIQIGDLTQLIFLIFFLGYISIVSPFVPGIMLGILILFTLIFFLFRIFFMLLTSYIKIILLIVFAPVILILAGKTFSYWFKNLFAELMSFPIVIWINLVGYALINLTVENESLFRPPFLHEISGEAFGPIIGMGLILMTPKLIVGIKEMMGVKPGGIGIGPGIFFGGVAAVAGGAMSGLSTIGSLHYATAGLGVAAEKLGIKFGKKP